MPQQPLMAAIYDELHALAQNFFRRQSPGHTLQPTALVHEVYLRLADRTAGAWESREHFLAVAAKAMRQILMNHAESRSAAKRGGDWHRITLEGLDASAVQGSIDAVDLHEALAELERLDERQSRVVELRYFGGLTVEQAARILGVSPRTVELDWRMARVWLERALSDPRRDPS